MIRCRDRRSGDRGGRRRLAPSRAGPGLGLHARVLLVDRDHHRLAGPQEAVLLLDLAVGQLRGLDPDASYVFTNLDTGESQTLVGRELLIRGLAVSITEQPGSAVITYQKAE